jgi:hypothetical protein
VIIAPHNNKPSKPITTTRNNHDKTAWPYRLSCPLGWLRDIRLQMMAMFGRARERRFSLRRVIPTASALSIIEAMPI